MISFRIGNRPSRDSTCTFAVKAFLKACPSEPFCAETRRNPAFFRWELLVLAAAIA